MSERNKDRARTLRQRKPTTSKIESLIAGHVASGNTSADLRELAELSLEVSLLRERLAYLEHLSGPRLTSVGFFLR